jgi:hypothetical protein
MVLAGIEIWRWISGGAFRGTLGAIPGPEVRGRAVPGLGSEGIALGRGLAVSLPTRVESVRQCVAGLGNYRIVLLL